MVAMPLRPTAAAPAKAVQPLPANLTAEEESDGHATGSFEFRRALARKEVLESKRDFCRSFRGGSVAFLSPSRHLVLRRRSSGRDHQGDVSEEATLEAVEDFREQVLAYSLSSSNSSGSVLPSPREEKEGTLAAAVAPHKFEVPPAIEGAGLVTLGGSSSSSRSRSRSSSRSGNAITITMRAKMDNSDSAFVQLRKNSTNSNSNSNNNNHSSPDDAAPDVRLSQGRSSGEHSEEGENNNNKNDDDDDEEEEEDFGYGDAVGRQKDGSSSSNNNSFLGPAVLEERWQRFEEVVRSDALEALVSIVPGMVFAETVGLVPRILQPRYIILVGPQCLRVASVGFAGEPVIGDRPTEQRTPFVATLVTENLLDTPLDPNRQELVVGMRYRLRGAGPFETSIESSISSEAPFLLGLAQGFVDRFIAPSLADPSSWRLQLRCVELPEGEVQERGDVTFFCVHVFPADQREPWKVLRRYQQFRDLYCALAPPPGSIAATAFPRRHWAALAGEKLEFRRRCLEDWLNEVVREAQSCQPAWSEYISCFLEARLSTSAALASVADITAKQALAD